MCVQCSGIQTLVTLIEEVKYHLNDMKSAVAVP